MVIESGCTSSLMFLAGTFEGLVIVVGLELRISTAYKVIRPEGIRFAVKLRLSGSCRLWLIGPRGRPSSLVAAGTAATGNKGCRCKLLRAHWTRVHHGRDGLLEPHLESGRMDPLFQDQCLGDTLLEDS